MSSDGIATLVFHELSQVQDVYEERLFQCDSGIYPQQYYWEETASTNWVME